MIVIGFVGFVASTPLSGSTAVLGKLTTRVRWPRRSSALL